MTTNTKIDLRDLITRTLKDNGVSIYGFADLGDILIERFVDLKYAISIVLALDSSIVDSITSGPTQAYCNEYKHVNERLDYISSNLENEIRNMGFNAQAIPASKRTDFIHIMGEFPHKMAATRAGLGWIGKSSLLITREYGPRVRLSTVLTDLPLGSTKPVEKSYCGKCTSCIDACPAKAIVGGKWYPSLPREELVDVYKCDDWKKKNYFEICEGLGLVCGICMAVCPFGRKSKTK